MPKTPAVRDPEGKEYGPAMAALSPRRRLFVAAMYDLGSQDATAAARVAGYTDKGNGAIQVQAHRLIHNPDIKLAMQEEARRRLVAMLPIAINAVAEEANNPQSKDRLKAASMIMNRAGVHEMIERNINVNVTVSKEEKVQEIRVMAEALGLDPDTLLGSVEDAEFEEIPEGLEDVW